MSRRFREAPLFLGLFTFQIVLGAAVALTPVNLINLLIGTQVLQGIVTPVVLIYILVLANRQDVLGDAANSPSSAPSPPSRSPPSAPCPCCCSADHAQPHRGRQLGRFCQLPSRGRDLLVG